MSSGSTSMPELEDDAPEQNHYLTRLLEEAAQYFREHPVIPQELLDCDADTARQVKRCADLEDEEREAEIYRLCDQLAYLPMFQERLSFAINYPPSKWLLEWEQPYLKVR